MLRHFTATLPPVYHIDVWHQTMAFESGTVWRSRLSLSSQTVRPGIHPGMPQQDIRAAVASCVTDRCFMEVRVSPFVHTATQDPRCHLLLQSAVSWLVHVPRSVTRRTGRPVAVTTVSSPSLAIIQSRLSELLGEGTDDHNCLDKTQMITTMDKQQMASAVWISDRWSEG